MPQGAMHCPDHGCVVPAWGSAPLWSHHPAWIQGAASMGREGLTKGVGGVPADPVLLKPVLRSPVGHVMEEVVKALLVGKKGRGH